MIMARNRCYFPQTGHDHESEPWAHWGQRPKSSTVWPTSVKPASAATFSAHCSTARPSTSTLRPQLRQVRGGGGTLVSHWRVGAPPPGARVPPPPPPPPPAPRGPGRGGRPPR